MRGLSAHAQHGGLIAHERTAETAEPVALLHALRLALRRRDLRIPPRLRRQPTQPRALRLAHQGHALELGRVRLQLLRDHALDELDQLLAEVHRVARHLVGRAQQLLLRHAVRAHRFAHSFEPLLPARDGAQLERPGRDVVPP